MKNKPIRHKEENTFKFLPFAERIANIDVDVFHRIGHRYEEDSEETLTFFHQAIEKWVVLNLSENFEALRRELPMVQTLPQLLNKKEEIVAILSKNIYEDNTLALQPTLELVVALARDLRQEFYPYYPDFLRLLIELLKTKDAEKLEWTFTCLAYLFKFLWRYLVKDLDIVFDSLIPLLADNKRSYINNFAAESFAFVARKVKDKKAFLGLVLATLQARPNSAAGCGRLLFEVIRGVSGQFHSSCEVILPLYFSSLADELLPQDLLFNVLTSTLDALLSATRPQKSTVLWTSLDQTLSLFISEWQKEDSKRNAENICLLLKLLQRAIDYKDCRSLVDPVPVVRRLVDLLKLSELPEHVIAVISEIGASLLLSSNANLPQEHARGIMLRLLAVPYPNILLDFVVKVFDYSGFEALVLPHLLSHCHNNETKELSTEILQLLTRLVIHKAVPCTSGMDLKNWRHYPLDFPSSSISDSLLNMLSISNVEDLTKNFEDCLCSLLLLPHMKPLDLGASITTLKNIITTLCTELSVRAKYVDKIFESLQPVDQVGNESNDVNKLLFMLGISLEAIIHLVDCQTLRDFCDIDVIVDTLLPHASKPNNVASLRALDIYFTALNLDKMSESFCLETLEKLHGTLAKNLSSAFHDVRLLTCHLFSLFEREPNNSSSAENVTHWSLFSLCLAAESVPATLHEYRDKQKHLQNLEYSATVASLSESLQYNKVPLQYLLGVLYVNFQLLWEPVSVLIASYAHGMSRHVFWEVFVEHLHIAARQIKTNKDCLEAESTFSTSCSFLTDLYMLVNHFDDKPDYVNYRILLWKAMTHFPDICAKKTRDVSPLFFTFLEEEYFKSNAGDANSWNVKLADREDNEKEVDDTEPMETDEVTKDSELDMMKKKLTRKPHKAPRNLGARTGKSLSAHMTIFTKFKDPFSVYREPELTKIYNDFLTHKNHEIQKLALDCLMTYKHKFILPYREHLYGLMNDRTFKSELTYFRVDKESELIQASHREELMPIVMRIVHSKMLSKATSKRGGVVAAVQIRRSIVLRFLAGCHEEELMLFVKMSFKIYTRQIQDDVCAMVDSIMNNVDLEKVIPPKRLHSSMNLLGVILSQFGGLMGEQLLLFLLRVLLCITAHVAGMLKQRESIHPGYITTLKAVRKQCLENAAEFFNRFNKFDWSSNDIDAAFQVLVFPWLDKLAVEGIHSPTALLKLFLVWSEHPRYFALLVKHAPGDMSLSPLPHIMQLFQREQTHPSVYNAIMELVERLLTLADFETMEDDEDAGAKAKPLSVSSIVPIDTNAIAKLSLSENINYGSALLLTHIPHILERLKKKLLLKNKSLNGRELIILSRVSELVWESETSDTLLKLLLPMLMKKSSAGDDVVIPLITTLSNLIKNLSDPEKYIRSLAPLFGQVCGGGPRKMLSALMETIALRCTIDRRESLVDSLSLVGELNAWDKKWLDQPDFNRRLDAFKSINAMVDARTIDFDLGLIVIHTCFHYLKVEKDLSLRDSAGYCLRRLAPALCLQYADNNLMKDFLINKTILNLVCQGIRDKTNTIYNESIGLLGAMARECGDLHPVLKDLSLLTNKEDPEVDFFENLQHLQSHRKARALLKFCQVVKTLTKAPNPRTLTQFILPIASNFLLSEKYATKHINVDAAIETVGSVCRLVPWNQYDIILRYYLDKLRSVLEYQKQLVRIVVAILDAFHFDLSLAQNINKHEIEAMLVVETQNKEQSTSTQSPSKLETSLGDPESIDVDKILDATLLDADKDLDNEMEIALSITLDTEEPATVDALAIEKQTILSLSAAIRATHGITYDLLPQLHTCIAQRSRADTKHKLNRKQGGDDHDEEDELRVPIALAAVKLLQQLPKEMLDKNLPGIFMKLCSFLKSRLESIRRVTRHTLQKIMISLGTSYLPYLINEMCALLTRGFEVHVLVYTVHAVLVSLKDLFRPGDVDKCLTDVLNCCRLDLFGATAEEKKVAGIVGKVQEARSTKSYDTFQILAQFVTEKCFTDLIMPIQTVLDRSNSFKLMNKASECLRYIVIGLSMNKFVPVESLLMFMYGTISESIPELVGKKREVVTPAKREQMARQRPDTFIIPKAPRNKHGALAALAKTTARTNAHILVEFGLKLFQTLLKREKLRTAPEYRQFIDPVVPIISDCLAARHVKLASLSLHCLSSMFKMELPSMRESMSKIVSSIFSLLHKYAAAGLGKGDNFDLVAAAFKTVVVLVREVKWHTIDTEQLKALLLYAEQDMHDRNRQATAFTLLKAVLARKLVLPEIHEVMEKVAILSITSESNAVRMQGRQVFHQFLMDYPLGDKLDQHLAFFIAQLDYDLQSGRESALEMLHTVVSTFPIQTLSKQSGLLFVSLGARLINDEVPQCRKMVAQCLRVMLGRLENNNRDDLFDITLLWLKDKKVGHRRLAAQLCGVFVTVEKENFERRLSLLLPEVVSQFARGYDDDRPGKFVRLAPPSAEEAEQTASFDLAAELEIQERMSDHHMFQILQLILKFCEHCPRFLLASDWQDYVNIIADNTHAMLAHPHEWVRLASAQFLGHLFAVLDPECVAAACYVTTNKQTFLSSNNASKLKSLILDLNAQLQPEVSPELAAQVVKNLVFLGRVLKSVPAQRPTVEPEPDGVDSDDEAVDQTDVTLLWMVRRMRKLVNTEVVQAPTSTITRTSVFKWIGAMVLDLTKDATIPLLHHLLAPLVREMTSEDENYPEMHHLAIDVSKVMKNKVGMEEYTRHLSVLEKRISTRRADRKKARTREAITEPEMFAKRKIEKQLKKKDSKKRKIDMLKGRKLTIKVKK